MTSATITEHLIEELKIHGPSTVVRFPSPVVRWGRAVLAVMEQEPS